MTDTIFRVVSDDHSNHNLPIGATVAYFRYDVQNDVVLYTQGGDGDEVAIDNRDLEPLIRLSLSIENHYEDSESINTAAAIEVTWPPADEDEFDDWLQDEIFPHTGAGKEDGDSAYFVTVAGSSHPDTIAVGTEWEFGL